MKIKQNQVVLFQGDSITDWGRNRDNDGSDWLGNGYSGKVASMINAQFPELNITFYNRGISGNRVVDLKERWTADCIDLKPDWLSILIGINDVWRNFDIHEETTKEQYYQGYHEILTRVKNELPDTKLIILEPFVLPVPEDRKLWRIDLDPKIAVARELAREFNAIYIPLDGIFAAASVKREPAFWAYDGVHPTQAGHALIAKHWIDAVL